MPRAPRRDATTTTATPPDAASASPPSLHSNRAPSARLRRKTRFACGEGRRVPTKNRAANLRQPPIWHRFSPRRNILTTRCRVPTIISAADPRQLPIFHRFRPRQNILTTRTRASLAVCR
jgi:hypothetical protein